MATNTDKDIVKVGDLYYLCFQGVWFMSKAATGPWEVASTVPKEIYSIPTSSPVHNVTYVTVVEDDDDDEWVTYASVAAYTGVMVAWGCAVWGTGYYYPPYWRLRRGLSVLLRATTRPTGTGRRTTPGRELTAAAPSPTDLTAVPAFPPATTPAPEPTRAEPRPGARTERAEPARPTTRGREPTARRARARASTEAGAAPRCSAATSGPRRTG